MGTDPINFLLQIMEIINNLRGYYFPWKYGINKKIVGAIHARVQQDKKDKKGKIVLSLQQQTLDITSKIDNQQAKLLYSIFIKKIYVWNRPGYREIKEIILHPGYNLGYWWPNVKLYHAVMADGRIGIGTIGKSYLWSTTAEYAYDTKNMGHIDECGIYYEGDYSHRGPPPNVIYQHVYCRLWHNSQDSLSNLFRTDNDDAISIPEDFFDEESKELIIPSYLFGEEECEE